MMSEAPAQPAGAPAAPGGRVSVGARLSVLGERVLGERRSTRAAVWVLVPLLIALFSWHRLALEPLGDLDNSWHAALHMAVNEGITFGNHLIFTYGPLGFLSVPTLWYSGTGTIAVLYTLLLRIALAAAIFAGARRSYGTAPGALIALLVAGALGIGVEEELPSLELEAVPFLIFSVWVVDRVATGRRLLVLMAAGGAVAGLELLNKLSVGLTITALTVVMALAARGRRLENLLVAVAALVVTLLVGWSATGQSWGELSAFVHASAEIVSGYALAAAFEEPGLGWQYLAGAAAFAFGLLAALHMTADGGGARRRWGIVALWVTFCFFTFKAGFVRHDQLHATVYFAGLLGGFFALRWRGRMRLAGLGLSVGLLVFALMAQESSPTAVFDPFSRASTAVEQLGQVLSPTERKTIIARGREDIERLYPLDPATLNLVEGQTVHVAPYQTSVAWAYELDWRPLPAFQSYVAYTTALDKDNADALSSPNAPGRILRNLDGYRDGRVSSFEEPAATRTMLCSYQELRTTPQWQVLGLGPNRCQAPVLLATVRADWGQVVPVPAPPTGHSFVFVRISGAGVGGFERLTALLYRPARREIVLDGISHLLIAGTATDGLILRAAPSADFTPPYSIAPNSSEIAVGKTGHRPSGGLPLTLSFFAQSVGVGPRYPPLQRSILANG
jgi:hypothetical protein